MIPDEKKRPENQERAGRFTKVRAVICKHCPVCIAARKAPHSLVGRLLHHPIHAGNCPMWTAYRQVYGEQDPS
jgi:hypothetical protein